MIKNNFFLFSILGLVCSLCACSDGAVWDDFSQSQNPVVNGTKVTGTDRYSTVALLKKELFSYSAFCTGTLISPNYVLTAGHCVQDCKGNDMTSYRKHLYVGIGQKEGKFDKKIAVEVEDIFVHPDYICTDAQVKNDVAILKLSSPVTSDVAAPSLIIPSSLVPTVDEIDIFSSGLAPLMAITVGFGMTDPSNSSSTGVKYQTTPRSILAICPLDETKDTYQCDRIRTLRNNDDVGGFVYFYNIDTFICSGDSGGPTFITRDGIDYQIGISSWVNVNSDGECTGFSAMTSVDDYRSFIESVVTDLPSSIPEICDNGVDDNGDVLTDCKDPQCKNLPICEHEICYNHIDDNNDGLVDCADPQCAGDLGCIPENCTNGVDDNGNNLIDCADPACQSDSACVTPDVEICNNNIDDDNNGFVDCNDPACVTNSVCAQNQPAVVEICNNNIDDDNNGVVDCLDPACKYTPICVTNTPLTYTENCTNGIDDDFNGLVDCKDPACICGESDVDENGSDRSDNSGSSDSSCSALPQKPANPWSGLMFLGMIGTGIWLRRRKI